MLKNHAFGLSITIIMLIATILALKNTITTSEPVEISPTANVQPSRALIQEESIADTVSDLEVKTPEISFLDTDIDPITAQQIIIATEQAIIPEDERYSIAMRSTIHFNPDNVSESSGMTREQVSYLIKLYCPEWSGMEDYLLKADKRLNLLFILGVARMETWAGEASIGAYNCFNVKVWNSNDYINYSSYSESIDAFIELINNQYLSPDGIWYEGSKSIAAIGQHYATNVWAEGITNICLEMKKNVQKG